MKKKSKLDLLIDRLNKIKEDEKKLEEALYLHKIRVSNKIKTQKIGLLNE